MAQRTGSGGRGASVKDVAARAGVSLGTVSNVLNRPELVSAQTRDKVAQAMVDLEFVRNEGARQLRAGQSRTLCYVMLDAGNPFFTDVAQGMDSAAEAAGLSLFMCNSDNRLAREHEHLERLRERRVQGIMITPVDVDDPTLAEVARGGTPLVIVDRSRTSRDLCSVAVDDVLGGRLAIEHLLDIGHRRVAFVGGPTSLGQVADRLAGARAAWADAGLPEDDLLLVTTTNLTVADGRSAGERILGLPRRRRPTAAFCANDLLALGLLQQTVASGRLVPQDLAIIGFDDIDFAAAAAVPLSSVRQPRQELGRAAAAMLFDEVTNPDHVHEQVLFVPELVARASTAG